MSDYIPTDVRAAEEDEADCGGEGGAWSLVTGGGRQKRPRQQDRPKFVVCLDQARRTRPISRALVMATRPQPEPLFPGCSESESEDSDLAADEGESGRSPKFVLADVQCLLSYALLANYSLQSPRWCRLVKPTSVPRILVVVIDSAGPELAAQLPKFVGHFYQAMRLLSPYACGDSVSRELFALPLRTVAKGERDLLAKRLVPPARAVANTTSGAPVAGVAPAASATVEEQPPPEKPAAFPEKDKFPRTELLLSSVQLLHENYPIPGLRSGSSRSANYHTSLPVYQPATPSSPLYGLDCEMVATEGGSDGGQQLELARATLVDEAGTVLMDRLVKPPNPVVNYLTQKSGITRELLDGATETLEDVQKQLANLLPPDAIIVGHSLNCDLHALQICHPNCIDTSVIYNLSGSRKHKAGLRALAQRFLHRDIQSDDAAGHNSAEDALAALQLVQLKLSQSLEYGDTASGCWSSAADANGNKDPADDGAPSAKRAKIDSSAGGGDFHASLRGVTANPTLFDWLRVRGVPFRVFDRRPDGGEEDSASYMELPAAFLRRDFADDAAAIEAARAEVKQHRLIVLRLRCLEDETEDDNEDNSAQAAAKLATLDNRLAALYDALPVSSLSIALFPGRMPAPHLAASGRCYFNMKGMSMPLSLAKK